MTEVASIILVFLFDRAKQPHVASLFEEGLWGFSDSTLHRNKWQNLEPGSRVLIYGDKGIRMAGYVVDRKRSEEPVKYWVNNPTGYPLHVKVRLLNRSIENIHVITRSELISSYNLPIFKAARFALLVFGDTSRKGVTYSIEKFNRLWTDFINKNQLSPEAGPPADIDLIMKQLKDRETEIDRLQTLVQEKEEQLRRLQAQLAPSLLDMIIEKLGKAAQLKFEEFEWLLAQAFSQIGFEAKWNGEMKGEELLHAAPPGKADIEVLAPLAGDPYCIVVEGTKNEEEKYQVTEVHGAVDHSKGLPVHPYKFCYRLVIAPHFKKGAIEACDRMDPRYPVMLLTSDNLIEILRFHKEVGGVTQEEVKKLFDQASGKGEVRRDQIETWVQSWTNA